MSTYTYDSPDLDLFCAATQWKGYLARQFEPYLGEEVLEVGAGIGGTTKVLFRPTVRSWRCLEPDPEQAERIEQAIRAGELPSCCVVTAGTLQDLPPDSRFDTILYVDVLEHIEDDLNEVIDAGNHLRPGGYLVVLCPAHQWLYTKFDEVVGHHRRYSKGTLSALTPPHLDLVRLIYLDAVGLLASLGNRLLLKQGMPTAKQIAMWDKGLVPMSKVVDRVVGFSMGKSVLAVWQRKADGSAAVASAAGQASDGIAGGSRPPQE